MSSDYECLILGRLPEPWVIELLTVIEDEYSWDAKSTYHFFPNKALDVFLGYCG